MTELLGFLGLGALSFFLRPDFLDDLAGPAQGERIGRNIFGDGGCGTDISPFPDANRRHQDAVAADKHAIFNDGFVFVHAVAVAGDGSGADVDAVAHFSVAQIGQVVGLGALTHAGFLHFHEIANVSLFADLASRAQMAVGPERGPVLHDGMLEYTTGLNEYVIPDFAIENHAVGPDTRVAADAGGAAELDERLNYGIGANFDAGVDHAGLGIEDGDAGGHEFTAFRQAHALVNLRQFGAGVGAQDFVRIIRLHRHHALSCFAQNRGHVGEVKLAVMIVGIQFVNAAE